MPVDLSVSDRAKFVAAKRAVEFVVQLLLLLAAIMLLSVRIEYGMNLVSHVLLPHQSVLKQNFSTFKSSSLVSS